MERVRHLFIINPAAGKHMDTVGIQKEIKTAMADRNEPWEVMLTKGSGDAEAISHAWAEQSSDPLRIYAMGGDGTLNEVVNGVVGCDHVSVGCCPLGSGNDFVKTFGRENWRFRDLRSLVEARPHTMDLIECNGRYAINVCSVGFDARIGLGMADYKRLPLVTGKGAYLVSLVVTTIQGYTAPMSWNWMGKSCPGSILCSAPATGSGTAAASAPCRRLSRTMECWTLCWSRASAASPSPAWWASSPPDRARTTGTHSDPPGARAEGEV